MPVVVAGRGSLELLYTVSRAEVKSLFFILVGGEGGFKLNLHPAHGVFNWHKMYLPPMMNNDDKAN
jgi:hypothetical protein